MYQILLSKILLFCWILFLFLKHLLSLLAQCCMLYFSAVSILFYFYISRNCLKALTMAWAARWRGLVPWKENSFPRQAAQNKLCGLPWVTRSGFLEKDLVLLERRADQSQRSVSLGSSDSQRKQSRWKASPQGEKSQGVPLPSGWTVTLTILEMLPWSGGVPRGAAYPHALHNGSVEGSYLHGTDGDSDISTWLR